MEYDELKRFQKELESGQLLFRYRAVDKNSLNALMSNRLYFSKPIFFNDPYDSLLFVDGRRVIEQIARSIYAGMDNYLEKLRTWNISAAALGKMMWSEDRRDELLQTYLSSLSLNWMAMFCKRLILSTCVRKMQHY